MDSSGVEAHVIALNCQAMKNLANMKYSLKLLQEAESLMLSKNPLVLELPNRLSLLAVTFNNLACYYKNSKQPNVALFYLNQALELEIKTFVEPSSLASTNLNLCAIYSHLGKHSQAIKSAMSALKYLKGYENEPELSESVVNSLLVANYNLGVEYEHLKNYAKAAEFYQQGYLKAKEYFGLDHSMAIKLSESLKNVKEHSESLNVFISSRRNLRNLKKIASQSVSPVRPPLGSELKIYSAKANDMKLPKIVKKAKRNLMTHRQSVDSGPKDFDNLTVILENSLPGSKKFNNAIERLKMLVN